MKIAIASPPVPASIAQGLSTLEAMVTDAARQGAKIICFPESYIPGYPGMGDPHEDRSLQRLQAALDQACEIAVKHSIAVILPMDWHAGNKLLNVAFVISEKGEVLGYQSKNQLDPSEDNFWEPGDRRQVFDINGLRIGIAICHEAFRYPETVRWAARHGAQIVFHPHFTGSNTNGPELSSWGAFSNPYYERAMMMRALENTIYFASSNYATRFPESASAIISPDGSCLVHAVYTIPSVIVADINPDLATGFLANRFKPETYN
ncbi:MAG: carbon-nitrogen hydrolase family protein [Chitinophagaceae bacterium]